MEISRHYRKLVDYNQKRIVMKRLMTLALILSTGYLSAQDSDTKTNAEKYLPNIGAHAGFMSYNGDIGKGSGTNIYSNIKFGYGFYLEKKIANLVGISLNANMGTLAKNRIDTGGYWSFESKVQHFDLGFVFDFDNGYIIKESSGFAPFVSVGIGYMMFDPHGDLKDANGNTYYHWNDGSLRDLPQADTNLSSANILHRDYTYESQLKDSVVNYARNAITLPIKAGFKFNISKNLKARVAASYVFAFTDYIDNVKANGNNDQFLYTSFGLEWDWGQSSKAADRKADKDQYGDVDFDKIEHGDMDNDGVEDSQDKCQGTPSGVEVDGKGCPKDDDKDGVPNYLDKEPNSKSGANVNDEGVTITDEMLEEMKRKKDSLTVEKKTYYSDGEKEGKSGTKPAGTLSEKTKRIQDENKSVSTSKVPAKFKPVDGNKDGTISAEELTSAIDAYFEGELDLTLEELNELVDYFFEQ